MPMHFNNHRIIALTSAMVAGLLLYVALFKPALDQIDTFNRVLPEKTHTLARLERTADQYLHLAAMTGTGEHSTRPGTPVIVAFAELEKIAATSAINTKMTLTERAHPSASGASLIEVQLSNITLEEMLAFVQSLHLSQEIQIHIDRLQLAAARNGNGLLDATMHLRPI